MPRTAFRLARTMLVPEAVIRTWRGGGPPQASDWSADANFGSPLGTPTPLDTARVPPASNPAGLSEDARVSLLIVAGGQVRNAGFRLSVKAQN